MFNFMGFFFTSQTVYNTYATNTQAYRQAREARSLFAGISEFFQHQKINDFLTHNLLNTITN